MLDAASPLGIARLLPGTTTEVEVVAESISQGEVVATASDVVLFDPALDDPELLASSYISGEVSSDDFLILGSLLTVLAEEQGDPAPPTLSELLIQAAEDASPEAQQRVALVNGMFDAPSGEAVPQERFDEIQDALNNDGN